jgi:hypothetical protein
MQNPFKKAVSIRKIVNAEKTTNKIRIPQSVVDVHGKSFLFEYNEDTGVITLTPFN